MYHQTRYLKLCRLKSDILVYMSFKKYVWTQLQENRCFVLSILLFCLVWVTFTGKIDFCWHIQASLICFNIWCKSWIVHFTSKKILKLHHKSILAWYRYLQAKGLIYQNSVKIVNISYFHLKQKSNGRCQLSQKEIGSFAHIRVNGQSHYDCPTVFDKLNNIHQ